MILDGPWDGPEEESADRERLWEERRRAVRLLLAQPLVTDRTADAADFARVRRHEAWLRRWFLDNLGYRLVVDPELARLHKRPAPGARLRSLRAPSGSPFTPRRYALLCLVLAALERIEVQTVLSELAEQVQVLAASEEAIDPFDLDAHGERRDFVAAVRHLVDLGALTLADGDDAAFVDRSGDALYDVHNRRLSHLLASPTPPALAEAPGDLTRESYPDTDEGLNRSVRHRLMRRLVEEPVLYLDELSEREAAYLNSQRPHLIRQTETATGLRVEVRREGLAAVDPADRLTDLSFPATGTVAHAALLLAEELVARRRAGAQVVPGTALADFTARLASRHASHWSRIYTETSDGPRRLADEALERLELMGLVERRSEGVVPRPALARYEPEDPSADAPPETGS